MSNASPMVAPEGVYLRSSLAPLESVLSRLDVTDIWVNRPHEIWVETLDGTTERHECEALSELSLARLARQVASLTHQGVSREHPLLAATLHDGTRIQVVAPPATPGPVALAIRRQVSASMTLQDFFAGNQFAEDRAESAPADDKEIAALVGQRRFWEALALAVRARKNILVSGGTSTGKTTFLNALLREVPRHERLIIIEDTPELICTQDNCVRLVCVRGNLGEALVTANDLVSASLRMRPDRIILGEIRGREAFAFLRAINSGHPGSMTTIHANSPESAIEQLAMLVLEGGTNLSRADVHRYIKQSIGVFVQLGRANYGRVVETVKLSSGL